MRFRQKVIQAGAGAVCWIVVTANSVKGHRRGNCMSQDHQWHGLNTDAVLAEQQHDSDFRGNQQPSIGAGLPQRVEHAGQRTEDTTSSRKGQQASPGGVSSSSGTG